LGVGRWALGVGCGRVTPAAQVDDEVTLRGVR